MALQMGKDSTQAKKIMVTYVGEPLPANVSEMKCEAPDFIIKDYATAHRVAVNMVKDVMCVEDIKHIFSSAGPKSLTFNRLFKVDITFVDRPLERALDMKWQQAILTCLPDERGDITMQQSVARLQNLKSSTLFKMVSLRSGAKLEGTCEIVCNIVQAIPPDQQIGHKDEFFMKVLLRLRKVCVQTMSDALSDWPDWEEGKRLVRVDALHYAFKRCEAKLVGKSVSGLGDLGHVQRFRWCLNDEEKKKSADRVRFALATSASSSSSASSMAAPMARASSHTSMSDAGKDHKAEILKFFM
eukprot:NODE_6380_length_1677_cov_3.541290.p1 GENE.NODE_6380_length_1677_cov_3.541290~~NODE_6380_length_1677_cov_3.541290.p1  ORF type:complete len:299 (+),score=47.04 NODE_6380_length_1677_cov_3.541290:640-1536(+)